MSDAGARQALSRAVLLASALSVVFAASSTAQPPSRPFRMGTTPLPPVWSSFGQDVAYSYLQVEADAVSHTLQHGVPWPEALHGSDWRTYPSSVLQTWGDIVTNDMLFVPGHARYVSIQPISSAYDGLAEYWGTDQLQALPAPWNTKPFDDPDVETAFLNYAIATVEFLHPTYLGISVEANILLARRPDLWSAYKTLNQYVYTRLKARYPDLVVFTGVQYEHMLGLLYDSRLLAVEAADSYPTVLVDEVKDLMKSSDLLALSTYPYMAHDALVSPAYFDTAIEVGAATGRQLAIEQTGYTSQSFQAYGVPITGSDAQQDEFVGLVLWTALEQRFAFVINFIAVDYGLNYGDNAVSLTWAYTGLFRQDGSAKPAGSTWSAFRQAPLVR
jgi:hypothetical protein